MPKVTLDMSTFKALASDTRLQILRALDGKKMNLQEISRVTKLNKSTLHEHLQRLHEAGLIKKQEREGHKWVYYKLSWKGEGLLHPENTRIVVMFTATFIALAVGIIQLIQYVRGYIVEKNIHSIYNRASDSSWKHNTEEILTNGSNTTISNTSTVIHDPVLQWIGVTCIIIFGILLAISIWRYQKNKVPKL